MSVCALRVLVQVAEYVFKIIITQHTHTRTHAHTHTHTHTHIVGICVRVDAEHHPAFITHARFVLG